MSAAGCSDLLAAEVGTRAAAARCNLLERLYAAGWRLSLAADGALEVDAPEPLDAGLAAALEADAAGIAAHVRRRDAYKARPEIVLLSMPAAAFDAYLAAHPEHPDHGRPQPRLAGPGTSRRRPPARPRPPATLRGAA